MSPEYGAIYIKTGFFYHGDALRNSTMKLEMKLWDVTSCSSPMNTFLTLRYFKQFNLGLNFSGLVNCTFAGNESRKFDTHTGIREFQISPWV